MALNTILFAAAAADPEPVSKTILTAAAVAASTETARRMVGAVCSWFEEDDE